MAFALIADVRPTFFNIAISKFLLVKLFKLPKIVWNLSICRIFKSLYEVTSCSTLIRSDESNGVTFVASASCATNPVNIVFKMVWTDIVDNEGYVLDIEATSTD